MVFLVKVDKSAPKVSSDDSNYDCRLSTIGNDTKTEHGTSFNSLVSSLCDKYSAMVSL
jgi:hypothetical protein